MSLYKLLKKGDIIHRDYHLPRWSNEYKRGHNVVSTEKWQVTKIVYRKNYKHDIYLTQIAWHPSQEQLFENSKIDSEFYLPLSEKLKKL